MAITLPTGARTVHGVHHHQHSTTTGAPTMTNPPVPNGHTSPSSSSLSSSPNPPVLENGSAENHEPIAIIGMACRLPGGIGSAEDLWDFLCAGKSAQTDVPKSRFNVDGFYNPVSDLPDSISMRGGYFIDEDLRLFENSFFGVNNLEATALDPQMRKLLEICHECLESAGIRDKDVAGKNVGCYVGNFTADYQGICGKDPGHQHRLVTLAMSAAILSNRVSYLLDLMGPSLTLDTACSSSLYCLHLAVSALRNRECDAAFVAGSNLIQSHEQSMSIGRYGFLSKTSTCHTFDSSADGYGRADGVGAIYIKRLSDAIRDGDPIRSIIRGTAINSNGKTTSNITVPSTTGQGQVIARAYADAGIDPSGTDYIECHGTGTQVGDVVEVTALANAMRNEVGAPTKPLFVGSVKTNLGHSEASSGITSIIKATMALEQQWIPATIGVADLNPSIQWKDSPVQVVTVASPWPTQSEVQRASINSFGFGGANGHCILERYIPSDSPASTDHDDEYPAVLPLSAASMYSLRQRAEDLSRVTRPMPIRDLAYTLANRRSKMSNRSFIIAANKDWQSKINLDLLEASAVQQAEAKPLAFIFTGQGAQWLAMGKQLFERFPTFRHTISQLDETLANVPNPPDWSLESLLASSEGRDWSTSPLCSQTACTGLQVGLVDLLKEWGVFPRYVVGHSAGEIGAAYAAGHISASRAITIAYGRGMQVAALSTPGAMIAVGLGEREANEEIQRLELSDRACVGCINSPGSTTVSGDQAAIDELLDSLSEAQVFARKLKTGGIAYHSHHMKAIGVSYQKYLECLAQDAPSVSTRTAKVEMISTVQNRIVGPEETATAAYWKTNLESPVRFQQAIETLQTLDTCQFVEIGPHSALELPIKQTLLKEKIQDKAQPFFYIPSISRNKDTAICMLNLAGHLWCRGYAVDLDPVNTPTPEQRIPTHVIPHIPRYRWNYGPPLWKESRRSDEYRNRKFGHDELLGTLVPGMSGSTHTWRNKLMLKDAPWLADHKLSGEFVFPGAAYVDMALKAMQQIHNVQDECLVIRNMRLLSALTFDESEGVEIFTELQQQPFSNVEEDTSSWEFTISTWGDGQVVKRAVGIVGTMPLSIPSLDRKMNFDQSSEVAQKSQNWYRQLSKVGVNYGPLFQMLSTVSIPRMRDQYACRARFEDLKTPLDPYQGRYKFRVHPTVFDAMLQSGLIAHTRGNIEDLQGLVPTAFHYIRFYPSFSHDNLTTYDLRTREKSVAAGLSIFDSELVDGNGRLLMEMCVDAKRYTKFSFQAQQEKRYPLLRSQWIPDLDLVNDSQSEALTTALVNNLDPPIGRREEMLRLLYFASLKQCDTHILAVSSTKSIESIWTSIGGGTAHPRFSQLTFAHANEFGGIAGSTIDQTALPVWDELKPAELPRDSTYDLIVIDESYPGFLPPLDLLAADGMILCLGNKQTDLATNASIEHIITGRHHDVHILRHRLTDSPPSDARTQPITIITDGSKHPFNTYLANQLSVSTGIEPTLQALDNLDPSLLTKDTLAIITAELSGPLLTTATPSQLSALQLLVDRLPRLLWISGSDLPSGSDPNLSAVLGLSRAVMLENPAVAFQVLGIESLASPSSPTSTSTSSPEISLDEKMSRAADAVRQILRRPVGYGREHGFAQREGLLHVCRFVPDEGLNKDFNAKKESSTVGKALREVEGVLDMDIGFPGQFDSLRFKERLTPPCMLNGDVEIGVMAIGINAKDVYALSGKVKTVERTFAMDYAGVVRKVKPGSTLKVGDRVVVSASGAFATVVTVPELCCVRLRDDESFTQMSTVPLAFMTALHALEDRARLQSHESVLIHSAAGGVGMAAIQVAKMIGATIYATTGTEEKREMLVKEFGLRPEHIFNSRDTSFLEDIKRVTSGRGVDVVLNSLTGDRLRASMDACAHFGRFVEIGKKDIADCGKLDLSAFSRSLTFTAFDLNDYFYSPIPEMRSVLVRLLRRGIDVFRSYSVPAPRVFDAGHVSEAYHAFANSKRTGKISVSFESPDTIVQVQPRRHRYPFSPLKSYLLVGGLGGVGRSIARYMFENGARHFTFVGKSGADKPAAQSLLEDLRRRNATVEVITGDIGDFNIVREAITGLRFPLGGVLQAAMGLGESLFEAMTHEKWHSSLGPKVQGTWNIHRATEGYDSQLEFFLMISSLAGSMGSLAESNYCSANSFLDSFAEYRRGLGKPATTLAFGTISEVGYLHEHPEIEEMLKRRGLTAITEADLLDMCDLALCDEARMQPGAGHILTGLESTRELFARRQGLPAEMADPRVSILVHAGKSRVAGDEGAGKVGANGVGGGDSGPPPAVRAAIEAKDHGATVQTVLQVLTEKLSQIILTPVDSIPPDTTLANAGIDSMLAAEYRSFMFHTFKTDVPFLTLMDAQTTMSRLATRIADSLLE